MSTIDVLLYEKREFPPPPEFAAQANGKAELYDSAREDVEAFWADRAREYVTWHKPFTETLDWSDAPFAKWFADGTLNVAYNCVDRHVEAGNGDRIAIRFVGEPGDERDITYAELQDQVMRAANAMLNLGVQAGDRVAIYLPMIPEGIIAMLACARIGAPHSVIFGGFSSDALKARIDDAQAKLVITSDGGYRRGKPNPLKPAVDGAITDDSPVQNVLVVKRTGDEVDWHERDIWWHEALEAAAATHEPQAFPAEHPLFILYTSGTTGSPKGIYHTSGGYLTHVAYTSSVVHDIHPETDVFWCSADIGWITGHSYLAYGPHALGATQVLYEGTPDTPHQGRWWEIIQNKGVTIFYTAPTAIRTFMKWGRQIPAEFDLSSIRLLGSVGEPINPEAWIWYHDIIGGSTAPIVDTWWQTETGGIMISALPGLTTLKPGSAQVSVPGIEADVVDDDGNSVPKGTGGLLVIRKPWPGMLRGIWGDPERFKETYWSQFDDMYFAGDGAKRGILGNIWILGRVDDVMNVSGHRLSSAEIESALVAHEATAEAAVVGVNDDTTGQAVCAFVILKRRAVKQAEEDKDGLIQNLRNFVAKEIGPIAKPKRIMIVTELPKTRSGKIMRRLLRDIAEHRAVGDISTLADAEVMAAIKHEQQQGRARGSEKF